MNTNPQHENHPILGQQTQDYRVSIKWKTSSKTMDLWRRRVMLEKPSSGVHVNKCVLQALDCKFNALCEIHMSYVNWRTALEWMCCASSCTVWWKDPSSVRNWLWPRTCSWICLNCRCFPSYHMQLSSKKTGYHLTTATLWGIPLITRCLVDDRQRSTAAWPPRAANLAALDSICWGCVKNLI